MTEKKKGRVTVGDSRTVGRQFVRTTKGVYPISVLNRYEIKKESKQLQEEALSFGIKSLVSPPYNPSSLLTLFESNSIFSACVEQIAEDVAGRGYNLVLEEGTEENDETKAEKEKIQKLIDKPNPEDSLREILNKAIVDLGSVGWFGIEVVKSKNLNTKVTEISELYHIPAHTFRVHKNSKKFCQLRNNSKVWFKKYGEEKDISAETGEIVGSKAEDKNKANELIYFKKYYSKSSYYGVPNIISAIGSVVGLISIRDYNLAFFENYGVPVALITLEGEWEAGSAKKIRDFLDSEVRNTDNAHKTMVFEVPDGCKFVYTPLITETKESSFRFYQQSLVDDVLIAYRMPPERIGVRVIGSLGGNVAVEATHIYAESVVEPLQTKLASIINSKILQEGLGCVYYSFEFVPMDVRDFDKETIRYNTLIENGAMTPNQMRSALGLGKPYPGGDKYYIKVTLLQVGEEEIKKKEEEIKKKEEVIEKKQDEFVGAMIELVKGVNKIAEN